MAYLWKKLSTPWKSSTPWAVESLKYSSVEAINGVSVVIPTLNEAGNVSELTRRIDRVLTKQPFPYELVFVDDHSDDATRKVLAKLARQYPLTVHLKRGERGKAYSLLEGFGYAKYNLLAIIDADCQYPPEALADMIEQIAAGYNVVVANRLVHKESLLRAISSRTFSLIFTRLLHGFTCDVQAGLKMFRRRVLDEMDLKPTPWTFDLAFMINARNAGHGIGTVDITFDKRVSGESKVHMLRAVLEIGFNALALKFRRPAPVVIAPDSDASMAGAGIALRGKRFITHTTLDRSLSALITFTGGQKLLLLFAAAAAAVGLFLWPLPAAIFLLAVVTIIYFLDAVFNLYLVRRSLTASPAINVSPAEMAALDDRTLPVYSILCPLYREANIVEGFVRALERLDWPKSKLEVLLLLEEDDTDTIAATQLMALPAFVRTVVVPNSQPKTKPKACNFGLAHACGEYVVIYDAEDIPDPQQLKKAYLAWRRVPASVKCLQAKLNYFNPRQNLLTRFFTAEYSQWFDVMLPGMQSINTAIPLGGTSNHFRTRDLEQLEGWDPFNVTEDCDLGMRLFKKRFRTAIIDSVTMEEANSQIGNWIRQRSRWLKGYMQTYLVHMRQPVAFFRQCGWHALAFQFIVGGKVAFMVINPLLWLATVSYFAAYGIVGSAIEAVYPGPILLLGAASLIFGNFLYFYYYMIGCAARGQWRLIKYVYLIPAYWLLISAAAYVAFYQLLVRPHYWEKTRHGLHRKAARPVTVRWAPALRPAAALLPGAARGLVSPGSLLVGAMMASNVFNFGFNAFLGRVLDFSGIGLVVLINTLWQVATLFLGALATTVNHRTAYLVASQTVATAASFFRSTFRTALVASAAMTVVWLLSASLLADFLNLADVLPLLLFSPMLTLGVLAYLNRGWLHGTLRFSSLAGLFLIESVSKFLLAAGLVVLGRPSLAYLSIPLSVALTAAVSVVMTRGGLKHIGDPAHSRFPRQFFSASLLTSVSAITFLNLDVFLAQHYLATELAGQYALLSLVGKMIYFLGALPNIFMITLVSRDEGLKRNPAAVFSRLLLGTTVLTGLAMVLLGAAGAVTVPYLFGFKAAVIVPLLGAYTLAIGLFTITNSIVTYHLARRHYLFPALSVVASLLMIAGISQAHTNAADIVAVVLDVSLIGFIAVAAAHLLRVAHGPLRRAAAAVSRTAASLVQPGELAVEGAPARILIFNWRDLRHAFAGGSEVYIQRMAEAWAAAGHEVTLFCGNDGRSPRQEQVDGVAVIRRGGFYLVYAWAVLYYLFRFRGKYDVIVDCHNGIPFFTPLYARAPVFCLMHHVHQAVFRRSLVWPLATLARWLEHVAMPLVYRKIPIITVSQSSRQDMQALGLGRAGIRVVHPGIDLASLSPGAKSLTPLVLYLGRLAPYKSVDVLIEAFRISLRTVPKATLVIAGSGEDEARLRELVKWRRLGARVQFAGRVTEQQKAHLLRRAWVMVNPSFMEGWGITTIEANASGTPVVASNVGGLRDSVVDQQTGLLFPYGDVHALANYVNALLRNRYLRARMSRQAAAWAQRFDFTQTSRAFLAIITGGLDVPAARQLGALGRGQRRGLAVLRAATSAMYGRRWRQARTASVSGD